MSPPLARRNQALATAGGTAVTPTTRAQLDARNALIRDPQAAGEAFATTSAEEGRAAHSGRTLPDYTTTR
ncbi:hypothetical protein OG528_36945 [Streptomyces platensis]|uniref:hypothetical protein n=1 Tax=Streptomyces platensis TaxID=58346 RepID=UPI0030DE7D3D